MKLKSLILGSVAAVGLSTAGFAADLGVLTSLDVCDALGLSGLTISSDTNCLQISGGVSYEFQWGDWDIEAVGANTFDGARNIARGGTATDPVTGATFSRDWESKVEAWLQAVGTADSDFGPAKATIRLKSVERYQTWNEGQSAGRTGAFAANSGRQTHGDTAPFNIDQAFVSVGDTTVIMAGKKGSIANLKNDEPFNFLGLFNSDAIDGKGVGIDNDYKGLGGHVIQVVSDLGNGLNVGVGLENLNGNPDAGTGTGGAAGTKQAVSGQTAGTLVGVLNYAGDGISANATVAAFGVLDGVVESWAAHAGATGTFENFKIRAAASYWSNFKFNSLDFAPGTGNGKYGLGQLDVLNAMIGGQATFDMFTISLDAEVANAYVHRTGLSHTDWGVGGSVGFAVSEGISINLGSRHFYNALADEGTTQVAAQLVAAITETVKVTGEIGGYFGTAISNNVGPAANQYSRDSVYYGSAELAWNPKGGFTSSVKGEINSENAYKVTFKAAKTFE